MNIVQKGLTIEEALALMPEWYHRQNKYTVMVERGVGKFRHYAARWRKRDGKLLYRGGSLVRAEATYVDGELSTIVFYAWEK